VELPNVILGITFIFCGSLIILPCIPLLREKVKMNKFYGVRFRKSFESEENWYKINRYGAKQFVNWPWLLIFIDIITFFLPLDGNSSLTIILAFCPALIVIPPAILSYLYDKKQ
jgi:hypothetical protein